MSPRASLGASENGWRGCIRWYTGWTSAHATYKKRVNPTSKKNIFVIEKSSKDVKQGQKVVPGLLKSIMKPSDPVKEELRRILLNMCQFGSQIKISGL